MAREFQPTRWSLIQQVAEARAGDEHRERAWQEFDKRYREPLISFVRRVGWGAEESEDLVQSFLAKLAERDWLGEADSDQGKMRTFLLGRLKHHLSDARKHLAAKKRGGGAEMVAIGESISAPDTDLDPHFDREWAHAILARTLGTLRDEAEAGGKSELFALLHSQITGDSPGRIDEVAAKLGQTPGATRMQLQRLRDGFRQALRAEVAETLMPGEDLADEMRYLASVLR